MDLVGVLCRCLSPKRCDEPSMKMKGLVHTNVLEWRLLSAFVLRALQCRSTRYNAYGCGGRTGSFCVKMLGASVSGSVHPHCVIVEYLFLE